MSKTMKKFIAVGFMVCAALLAFANNNVNAEAAVKGTLKNGTYTVSGKGKMPDKARPTDKQRKKIKKVVIKKGVTSICRNAFWGCKKLKSVKIPNTVNYIDSYSFYKCPINKVTIPKSVKTMGPCVFGGADVGTITMPGSMVISRLNANRDYPYSLTAYDGRIDKVVLTSNLDPELVKNVFPRNFVLLDSDPNYKSINGAIYNKEGDTLLFVPAGMKNLVIDDKCETISMDAMTYKYPSPVEDDYVVKRFENITIGEGVKNILFSDDEMRYYSPSSIMNSLKSFTVKSKQLSEESVYLFMNRYIDVGPIIKGFIDAGYIETNNGFFLVNESDKRLPWGESGYTATPNGHILYGYYGKEETVTIPHSVTVIENFADCSVKTLICNDELEYIHAGVFHMNYTITDIKLNAKVKVGIEAFYDSSLEGFEIPEANKW